jgi:hypothetical protein
MELSQQAHTDTANNTPHYKPGAFACLLVTKPQADQNRLTSQLAAQAACVTQRCINAVCFKHAGRISSRQKPNTEPHQQQIYTRPACSAAWWLCDALRTAATAADAQQLSVWHSCMQRSRCNCK